jgi:TolB-like protein
MRWYLSASLLVALLVSAAHVLADDQVQPADDATAFPVAILPFKERGDDVQGLGDKVTDLLFASLLTKPDLFLVDREDLGKMLAEQELNISGAVNAAQAAKVGQLTGAKILVTGSVLQVENTIVLVAKIIGTETTRVVGASVKGGASDELTALADDLGKQVGEQIVARAGDLVAKPVAPKDRIASIGQALADARRPSVRVKIDERHVGQATIDPAAETEIAMLCKETGFTLLDDKQAVETAPDVIITGAGFSEFAGRVGNLTSVKARVEVKAVDRKSGKVLAIDRQTAVVVDLSEQIAGKTALQEAAAIIAERMLPKLVSNGK